MKSRIAPVSAALAAAALLAGCGGGGDASKPAQPTQATLPFVLEGTASGVVVRQDGTVVVTDAGADRGFGVGWSSTRSEGHQGRILELAPDATTPDKFAEITPMTLGAALRGDDLYIGEFTVRGNDPDTFSDDEDGFQVRVYRNGNSDVIPFDLTVGGASNNETYAMAVAPSGDIYLCAGRYEGNELLRLPTGATTPELVDSQAQCGDGLGVSSNGDVYSLGEDMMLKYPGGSDEAVGVWMPAVSRPVRFTIGPDDAIYVVDNGVVETGQRIVRFTDGSGDGTTIPFKATVGGYHDVAVAENGDIILTDDNLVFRLSTGE